MLNNRTQPSNNHVPLESKENLEIIFRQHILAQNPNIKQKDLEKQIAFLVERAQNIEQLTDPNYDKSDIADEAHKLGLECNMVVVRKASKKFNFSAQ
jgi:hypothetical protein